MGEWVKPCSSKEEPSQTPDQCVACGKTLVPPVSRCQNGHGMCYISLLRLKQTCTCGEILEKESVSTNLPPDMKFSYMNRSKGCTQKLTLDVLEEHEATCPYNPNSPVAYCQII